MWKPMLETIKQVKNQRTKSLERFHIGEVACPLYQNWNPVVWGTVVEINPVTHKVILDFGGLRRQFEPNELILTNPELRTQFPHAESLQAVEEFIRKRIHKSLHNQLPGIRSLPDPRLRTVQIADEAYAIILSAISPLIPGSKLDVEDFGTIRRIEQTIEDLGFELTPAELDISHQHPQGGWITWQYQASFENLTGKTITVHFTIRALADGRVDRPWSAYRLQLEQDHVS